MEPVIIAAALVGHAPLAAILVISHEGVKGARASPTKGMKVDTARRHGGSAAVGLRPIYGTNAAAPNTPSQISSKCSTAAAFVP